MARYREALCRICRRNGQKLFLKGDRCYTEKCSVERRKYPPGQHGQRRGKLSDYGIQLREKQMVKDSYSLLERQFRRYFEEAVRQKAATGEVLLQLLERRLDNVVFRMGFAANRRQSREFVTHGFFLINGKKVSIPSYLVKTGDVVEVAEKRKTLDAVRENVEKAQGRGIPAWIELDSASLKARVLGLPSREDITVPVQEQLIVELYSK